MKKAILFDLGGTLVHYFTRAESQFVLEHAIEQVQNYLMKEGMLQVPLDIIRERFLEENRESKDHRVRPLEGRLVRIFKLNEKTIRKGLIAELCIQFIKPIFNRGYLYQDTLNNLQKLKSESYITAIVSNTTWGSPAYLWNEEVKRHQLNNCTDMVVFCRNVGWRKPARQIFDFVLDRLKLRPKECLFVGDNPRWDIEGPKRIGMDAVLIDRYGTITASKDPPIRSLDELWNRL